MKVLRNPQPFIKWLQQHGCEILPPTNEYELVRWDGKQVGILYTTGKVNSPYASKALDCFHARGTGKKWHGGPISTGRKSNYKKEKAKILERDGKRCFYCGKKLREDITLEHLIPLSAGGKNALSNMVLAHEECNIRAGVLPLNLKVEIAVRERLILKRNKKPWWKFW